MRSCSRAVVFSLSAIFLFSVFTGCGSEATDRSNGTLDDAGAGGAGGGTSAAPDLGKYCMGNEGPLPCSESLECRDEDSIGGWVCTKHCDSNADCPSGSHCYIFDSSDGHICARICTSHAECNALVPGLGCRELRSPVPRSVCAS